MAKARMSGTDCEVRTTRDLGDNWAVEIAPILSKPRKWEPYKTSPAPIMTKLHAESEEAATRAALEILKEAKKIESFSIEPAVSVSPAVPAP